MDFDAVMCINTLFSNLTKCEMYSFSFWNTTWIELLTASIHCGLLTPHNVKQFVKLVNPMTYFLTVPSHWLKQCSPITVTVKKNHSWYECENDLFKTTASPRGRWVKRHPPFYNYLCWCSRVTTEAISRESCPTSPSLVAFVWICSEMNTSMETKHP